MISNVARLTGPTGLSGADVGALRLPLFLSSSTTATPNRPLRGTVGEVQSRVVPINRPHTFAADAPSGGDADKVFNQLINLKTATAGVAMHLDTAWRAGLFKQLDQLLDPEEWDSSDELPSQKSFMTFLRLVTYLQIPKRPSLGVTSKGNLLAAWVKNGDRLVMEFQPDDHVRWSVARQQDGERETAAGCTMVRRLEPVLRPYEPGFWFNP